MVSVSSSTPSSSVKSSLAHHHHHHSNDGGNGNGSNGGTIDESAYLTEKLTPISSELSEPSMAPPMLRETSGSSTVSSSGDTMDVDDLIENDDSENDDDNNKVNAPFPTMRYKAIRQLGSGSFASVWLACDKQQNYREVAIKVVNKKSDNPVDIGAVTANVERARREASLLQTIEHPNIVTIFDEFETDDVYCLVLEFANGGDLFDWNGPEFERITRDIFGQLLDALLYLHARGIIHRDIKLENVLLEHVPVTDSRPSGLRVLLADFGLAIAQTPRGEQPLMAGSDEYAAPEAILQSAMSASAPVVSPSSGNASGGYDRCKTDVWSLGVVLYALLYGRLPFLRKANQTRRSFLYRVAQGDVSFPSDVDTSKAASEIVRALLRRKPGDRLSLNEIKHMPWVQNYMLSLNSSAHHS
ncbi:kinase-like domain-containing protein [Syncephalis plumigaleata]|nr:kinase-like domain-containing protein [Syncephalis plumigaleata]